jgi:hypothetical protein
VISKNTISTINIKIPQSEADAEENLAQRFSEHLPQTAEFWTRRTVLP